MALAASSSAGRGDVILQPSFFTSSLYVNPLREDIRSLIHAYHEAYAKSPEKPFALFKAVWLAQGWQWLHFRVFDDRSREAFIKVSLRLFLERSVRTEAPFTRVVALLGLYTFFNTQPTGSALTLYSSQNILIPLGRSLLLAVASSRSSDNANAASAPAIRLAYPRNPFNPRQLPREIYVDSLTDSDLQVAKKSGRPSKRDKAKKAKAALDGIDKWMHNTSAPRPSAQDQEGPSTATIHYLLAQPPMQSLWEYQAHKSSTLLAINSVPAEALDSPSAMELVTHEVLERLRQLQETEQARVKPTASSFSGRERQSGL
ncbi:hypothetical protein D9757_005420 [Collybiopsis confluens]|uniref:Uncharacterized protein n=1 Tax=Collybiopsis confluens TaxID=2823264 RepID=A0A8H5HLD2_9AGAR|nr:hypothetical protein D9757_005420 [Collybiopsis confluens]